jgi:hypothetical protein
MPPPKLFSIPSFRFSIAADPASAVGKWSRGATFGQKVKDGDEVNFSPATFAQMIENVEARGDKLAICQDHKSAYVALTGAPAPSLGFFYALAVFDEGVLVKHWAMDGGEPPSDTDDNGKPRHGLYCRLGEVTTLGLDPKEGLGCYGFLSPMFSTEDKDEQGNEIGYALMDFGATSTPFQAGCSIQFHKSTGSKDPPKPWRLSLDPEMMKRLGLAEGCSADEARGAMASQLAKFYAAEDEAKKMADDAAKDAEKMADEEKPAEEKKDEDKAEKMADEPDADDKKMAKDDEEEEKDDLKAMAKSLGLDGSVSPRAIRYAVEAKLTQAREAVAMRAELEQLRAAQSSAKEQSLTLEAEKFADAAIADGQWSDEKRDGLIKLYKRDAEDAKAVLFKKGEFTHVRKNFSKQLETRKGAINMGGDFSSKAQAYAKEHKVDLRLAQVEIAKQFPDLYKSYKSGE